MSKNGFEKIAGYSSEKKSLKEICVLLQKHIDLQDMGIRLPHGILLEGKPGVGKTVLAEALISESGLPCIRVSAGASEEGELASYLESCFNKAVEMSPAIVFLDELDKLVGESEGFRYTYNMANSRKVLQVLNDHREDDILVIATVNSTEMLCAAFKRSGRFDRILEIPLPTFNDRLQILSFYCAGKPISKRVNRDYVAKMTAGMTGADIECLVNEAGIHAVLEGNKTVRQRDFDFAVNQKIFHGASRENKKTEEQNIVLATHEAGHLVAGLINDSDCVTGVSILPQGESAGHCGFVPSDNELLTLKTLENLIVGLLAGKASEKLFFPHEEYLSSESDIEKASFYAQRLVTEEGAYGIEYIASSYRYDPKGVSEEKRQRIEQKCNEVLQNCFDKATTLLKEHKELVTTFVHQLVDKYSLSRAEIMRVFSEYQKKLKRKETLEPSDACA